MVVAQTSPADRPQVAKSPQRSRITNGRLLPGDNRSAWVRRCKDVIGALLADLGGEDNVSTAKHSIVRRCATITTELERLEARFAQHGAASPEDIDLYLRAANSLRRLLKAIGLERQPRDVTPTLEQYLASKRQREAAE